jgi:hypothetical protein
MLVKRGMPTNSVDAANAWRAVNAPPRNRKDKADRPIPRPAPVPAPDITKSVSRSSPPPPVSNDTTPRPSDPEPDDEDNTPRQSLRRARLAEKVGYNELVMCKRNGGSIEDIRKANTIYIAARNNRHKAERDFKDWQRQEAITLFFDEARDIASRPHIAVRQTLEVAAKTLAPRLHGQPQRAIEKTLAEWIDALTALIRQSI